MPTLYIPHGGGPCFFMKENFGPPGTWDRMEVHLRELSRHVPQTPTAILMISAHWEAEVPTVMTAAQPSMLYDYYGFPEHTYHLQYPAPGSPHLAAQVQELLRHNGFDCASDDQRGFDHGAFIPLMLIYPDAQIPVVQLSLQQNLDPDYHIRLGQALAPLRQNGVLMIGSGMSYHNLRAFFAPGHLADAEAQAFDSWLTKAATHPDAQKRHQLLNQWHLAPGAQSAHPREEHLLPLMVVSGAASDKTGKHIYHDVVMGKAVSSYSFA